MVNIKTAEYFNDEGILENGIKAPFTEPRLSPMLKLEGSIGLGGTGSRYV